MPKAPTVKQSKQKKDKIPRPPNAWILYRTDAFRNWQAGVPKGSPPTKQSTISREIAEQWRNECPAVKLEFEKRAAIAKAEHKKMYPNYKYNPVPKHVKEQMKALEREEKKLKAQAEKAAKSNGRKASSTSRAASASSPPSSSNVKLESLEQAKPARALELVPRGCGPSPPIDFEPDSSSIASTTPVLTSSSRSCSTRNSPLPSSSSSQPHVPAFETVNGWQFPTSSPYSSSPTHPPPPAYPSAFVQSPLPSRQSSYNFTPVLLPPSSAVSTASDSPPSYSEGEGWPSQPPVSNFCPDSSALQLQGDWAMFQQYPPLAQDDIFFRGATVDPTLLSLSGGDEQPNSDAQTTGSIFELAEAQPAPAQLPPGEVELQRLLQQLLASQTFNMLPVSNQADQVAPMLDMAELHETVDDNAEDADIPAPTDAQPWSLEDFASWVNTHPQEAMAMADPAAFYTQMGLDVMQAYAVMAQMIQAANAAPQSFSPPQLFNPPQPFNNAQPFDPSQPFSLPQAAPLDTNGFDMFGFSMPAVQPELLMPVPTHPVNVEGMSGVTTAVPTEVVPQTLVTVAPEPAALSSAPIPDPTPAPVVHACPPVRLTRRRVGGTQKPPQAFLRSNGN